MEKKKLVKFIHSVLTPEDDLKGEMNTIDRAFMKDEINTEQWMEMQKKAIKNYRDKIVNEKYDSSLVLDTKNNKFKIEKGGKIMIGRVDQRGYSSIENFDVLSEEEYELIDDILDAASMLCEYF